MHRGGRPTAQVFEWLQAQASAIAVGGGVHHGAGQLVDAQALAGALVDVGAATANTLAIAKHLPTTHAGTVLAVVGGQARVGAHTVATVVECGIGKADGAAPATNVQLKV